MESLKTLFGTEKPLIGTVTPGNRPADELGREMRLLYECGFHGILLEEGPSLIKALEYLRDHQGKRAYGLRVSGSLREAFSLAQRYGAKFLLLDSVSGHLSPDLDAAFARRLEEMRSHQEIFLFGGVRSSFHHQISGRTLSQDLQEARKRCDAVVLTAHATDTALSPERTAQCRDVLGSFPMFTASGICAETVTQQLSQASGVFVKNSIRQSGRPGNPIAPDRVTRFLSAAQQ